MHAACYTEVREREGGAVGAVESDVAAVDWEAGGVETFGQGDVEVYVGGGAAGDRDGFGLEGEGGGAGGEVVGEDLRVDTIGDADAEDFIADMC